MLSFSHEKCGFLIYLKAVDVVSSYADEEESCFVIFIYLYLARLVFIMEKVSTQLQNHPFGIKCVGVSDVSKRLKTKLNQNSVWRLPAVSSF